MSSQKKIAALRFAPMRIAILAIVIICSIAIIPIYQCVDEYEDIFPWLASLFIVICSLLVFLTLSLFFKETRREFPSLRTLRVFAIIRLFFASIITGFVFIVIADTRARFAVLCVMLIFSIFIFFMRIIASSSDKKANRYWNKSWSLFEFTYFQLALAIVIFELLCHLWPFRSKVFLLERPNMQVEKFIELKRSYTFQFNDSDRINSSGYFDREFVKERQEDEKREIRVALFADSFGAQYYLPEQFFPNIAESILNEQEDGKTAWDVMNYSMSGFGPREYVYLIEKEARFFNPDLYVICYFAGNDLYDAYSRSEASSSFLSPSRWYFYTIPWKVRRIFREKKMMKKEKGKIAGESIGLLNPNETDEALFSSQAYIERELKWANLYNSDSELDRNSKEAAYDEVERLFAHAKEITQGKLAVLIIPTYLQVNPEFFKKEMERYGIIGDIAEPNESIDRIMHICEINDIQCYVPLEDLRNAEAERKTYIINDIHWNENGQLVAGRFLAKVIESLQLDHY